MEYQEIVVSSIQSLRKNVLRTLLTMLGIIIGISSVILIVSLGQGAVKFITGELTQFGTNFFSVNPGESAASAFTGSVKTLTLEDAQAIEEDTSLTNVESVTAFVTASVKATANGVDDTLLVYGATHEMFDIFKPDILSGGVFNEEHETGQQRVAVMGVDAVETFFGENADPVGETIKLNNRSYRIIGVVESSSILAGTFFNNTLFIPIEVALNQVLGQDNINEIDIAVKNTDLINQTIDDVTNLLRDRHDIAEGEKNDFITQNFGDALTTVETITGLLTTMIAAIAAISLVVGGVGVMNIMLVTVTERTREIGLLKAIGARQNDILKQFLVESVVITVAGGIIGILIGILGAFIIAIAVGIPFVINLLSVLVAVGVSMLVGIVFGLYPARRAARLSPIDALRHE